MTLSDKPEPLVVRGIALLVACGIAGLLITVLVLYSKGTSFESQLFPYPNLATMGSYTAKKQLDVSKWTYSFDGGQVVQSCPTADHDADLWYNGHLIGRTGKKILTTVQTTYYRDGKGDVLWVTKAGSNLKALLNHVSFDVSLVIYDKTETTVLGYFAGADFVIGNEVYLSDTQGNQVVRMDRSFPTLGVWQWTVTLLNSTAPAPFSDFRFSALLAGNVAFQRSTTSNDVCNDFFWGVSWFLIAMAGAVVLPCCYSAHRLWKSGCKFSSKFGKAESAKSSPLLTGPA